ncbi:unnamed protein product, partial [Effrenium voratum]
ANEDFKEAYGLARGFLEEYVPEGGLPEPPGGDSASEDGGDRRRQKNAESEQEQLTKKLLPQLLRFVTEDQRALQ